MNSSPPVSTRSLPAGQALMTRRPTRLDLILEVRELCRQGVAIPVETVLSRHPNLAEQESVLFDLVYEEYYQRCLRGQPSDLDEFNKRLSAWGLNLEEFQAAKALLERRDDFVTSAQDASWPKPDQPWLNFELLGELGRGSFARVYLALEPALGHRPVVLKVSPDGAEEANTLGQLDHPNIVPVYSVHHDSTCRLTVVCMPYLGSATLDNVRRALLLHPRPPRSARMILESIQDTVAPEFRATEKKCPAAWLRQGSYVNAVLQIGHQLAQALAFVHEKGIYHRDLKPSNVLMTADGQPMLLDFNLSRHKQIADQEAAGTLVYMPPEQLAAIHPQNRSNSPISIDERSDLFSLGVILYELLTGDNPFGPIPRQERLDAAGASWFERQRAGPRPLREKNPMVDPGGARIIERCLAFDPKDRPRNAQELAAALGRQLSPSGKARRWVSLNASFLLIATILGMAGIAGGIYGLIPKEPYGVRQLHLGWNSYHHGRFEEAIQYLDRSIEADPTMTEAVLARARSFQGLGRLESAIVDFQRADELTGGRDGRVKAGLGYCLNLGGFDEQAILTYSQARDLNFATAEVLNNLGYSYTKWNSPQLKSDVCLDRAEECLTKALELNDRLLAAYYNRARVDLLRSGLNSERIPRQGLTDIQKAIKLGPVTAPLLWDASRLAWLVAQSDVRQADKTLDYLDEAIERGLNPKQLERDFIFHGLKNDSRFQALIHRPHLANRYENSQKVLDPFLD
jgi:serine/threonine protein kinase